MARIEKTVFISYRRKNIPWALLVYKDLKEHGFDAFFDYENIDSGDFEQVILGNIRPWLSKQYIRVYFRVEAQ
jgi:hypothetical protein